MALDWDTWTGLYKRLCAAKEHTVKGEQCTAYYDVLKEFPESCVRQAIYRASKEVTGWPKSDKLVELAREERRKLTAPAQTCDRCHGDTWVEAPDQEHLNRTYQYVGRCPQCWARKATVA